MDTTYRKNLKAVLTASKNYTDSSIEKLKWELGTYDLSITTDSTVAYTKTIPTNAIKGRLNYIGGASKVSENLIVLPDTPETTTNGITWKIQNGTIYLNGTASAYFSINLLVYCQVTSDVTLKFFDIQGTSSKSSIVRVNDTYQAPTTTGSYYSTITTFVLYTDATHSFTNYQIKPMLVKGTTAPTEFSEGFENIRSAKTTSVKFEGANILNPDNTFTYSTYTDLAYFECVGGATYTLKSFGSYTGSFGIFKYDGNSWSSIEAHTLNSGYTITSPSDAIRIGVNGVVSQSVMVVKGSTAPTTFKQYIAPITKAIPSEIQALEGYGIGINDTCYNYVDLINKKFIQKCTEFTISSNSFVLDSGVFRTRLSSTLYDLIGHRTFSTNANNNTISSAYPLGSFGVDKTYYFADDNYLRIKDISLETKEDFNNKFPNGITFIFEIETPVETDISQYIGDDFKNIDTTNMTTATFENEFGYAIPSEIDYLIEEVKA